MSLAVVLGLDFGGSKIALAVCGADGTRLSSTVIETVRDDGAAANFERAVRAGRDLLASSAPGARLVSVGACTFGIPREDGVALAPAVPGWERLAFGRELRAAFPGAAVRTATDVKAAAGVEARDGALHGYDPALYLNLGTGLAVAIVAGGTVLGGHRGASGEIGYNLRHRSDVGLPLDARTPLEDTVSGGAFAASVLANGTGTGISGLTKSLAAGGPDVARVLDDFTEELAFHLVNLAIAVAPARIAVGGGMVRSWPLLEGRLRHALAAAVPYPPELVPARHPFDGPLRGALALGLAAVEPVPAPERGPDRNRSQSPCRKDPQR